MSIGYISIGSNIDKEAHIPCCLNTLRKLFGKLTISSIYESEAVGFVGDTFHNLIVGFESDLSAKQVAALLRKIELEHGRSRQAQKFSSRTLDLDLLLYGSAIIHDDRLQIPRVDIVRYAFVLEPLAEIAPALKHPLLEKTYAELWHNMPKLDIRQKRIVFEDNL
jgi:2-amino-4-hydroxy-6-hydroxymethyldihydropteridine diphosphokinase